MRRARLAVRRPRFRLHRRNDPAARAVSADRRRWGRTRFEARVRATPTRRTRRRRQAAHPGESRRGEVFPDPGASNERAESETGAPGAPIREAGSLSGIPRPSIARGPPTPAERARRAASRGRARQGPTARLREQTQVPRRRPGKPPPPRTVPPRTLPPRCARPGRRRLSGVPAQSAARPRAPPGRPPPRPAGRARRRARARAPR